MGLMNNLNDTYKSQVFFPIEGNIYRVWYLGTGEKFTLNSIGLWCIVMIQFLGPIAIGIWAVYEIIGSDDTHLGFGLGDWRYVPGDEHRGISNVTKRGLSLAFIIVFALNGLAYIWAQAEESVKLTLLLTHLKEVNPEFMKKNKLSFHWRYIGPFLNCWVVIACTLNILLLCLVAESPKDVVYDSLGMIFLFTLDDASSDLAFLTTDMWNSVEFGKFYYEMLKGSTLCPEPDDISAHYGKRQCIYKMAECVAGILVLALPLTYIFLQGVVPQHLSDELHTKSELKRLAGLLGNSTTR